MNRSQQFYQHLGWQPALIEADLVFFQLNGLVLMLIKRSNLVRNGRIQDTGAAFGGVVLGYTARDRAEVDAVMHRVEAAQGQILRSAAEQQWGSYAGYFADPDQHVWQVLCNPEWKVDAQGMTRL